MDIKFTVKGQSLTGFVPPDTTGATVGYLDAVFTFSPDWDEFDKWLHLRDPKGNEPEPLELKDDRVDHLDLSAGRWEFWVHGNAAAAPGAKTVSRVVSDTVSCYIQASGVPQEGPLPPIGITAAEQIAANASYAVKTAEEALELAGKTGEAAILSESWAVGGTGTREGEDTDNARYYAEQSAMLGESKLDAFTIKSDGIPEITSPETLRTYFYEKRKETARTWQFEVSPGSNENLMTALGGFPGGHTAEEKWFLYINLPYSEAGGFIIHTQLEGRDNSLLYRQDQWSTLDARWHGTGWIAIEDVQGHLIRHEDDRANPHGVTAEQVGAATPEEVETAVAPKADTTYVDARDEATLSVAGIYAGQQDKAVLAAAKQYTDDSIPTPYELPQATATELGGVKAAPATDEDTQAVRIKSDGTLATKPTGGGGGGAVDSVNGQTGDVVLTASDVGAAEMATVAVKETITEITDEATLRTHFYKLRKSAQRRYQFEVSEGGIHENIVTGVGGRPQGAEAADSAFIYVDLPYSEAGGFIIEVTYQLRSKPGMWRKELYGTLDSRWQDTGWYRPTFIAKTVIAPHGSGSKADMTASQIINAARRGVVQADYTDPKTGELRTYQYFKQTTDGRATFAVNGYIEDGVPKQTLIYVDYAGNVTTETREPEGYLKSPAAPGTSGDFLTLGADGQPVWTTVPAAEGVSV